MQTVKTTLTTEAIFSDDEAKRYLLRKTWDDSKPILSIIMLAPSSAAGIELDSSTQLVLNNAFRLGFGSVDILNLFSTLNDFALKEAEDEDTDNLNAIIQSAERAGTLVYAAGTGKAKNKAFQRRQEQVLTALRPYEGKLHCLTDENGKARLQHPLSPAVRIWHLSTLKISGLVAEPQKEAEPKQKRIPRPKSKQKIPPCPVTRAGWHFSWEHRKMSSPEKVV